jgi:hypothetical protein
MDSLDRDWKIGARVWANVAMAELGCAAAARLRNCLTREDLHAARELIVDELTSEKPHVARYLKKALDYDRTIDRAVFHDRAIRLKRDALRNALIDAGCEDPLRPPPLS